MKKILPLSLLLLFVLIRVNAQSSYFNIIETEGYKDTNKALKVEAIYTTSPEEEIALANTGKNKLTFDIYDSKANKIYNKSITLEKKESVVGHIEHDNLLKVFTIRKPSKIEREIVCHILDIKNRSYKSVALFKTTIEKKQGLFSGKNKRQTNFSISPSGAFFAIATDNIKKNSNSYIIHVYNSSTMALVYKSTYFENPENFFKSFDMVIDDEGTVYSVGKEYKEGRAEKHGADPNYTIILNKVSEKEHSSSRIQLSSNEHIADLKIIQKENHLDLYGFYSEERAGKISGLNKITIEKRAIENVEKKQTKLPTSILTDIYSARRAEAKKDKDLSSYYLDYIIEDEEGNTTLLAEQFYITQTYMSNGQYGGGYWMTTYHYNNILVLNLDNEGEVKWGRSIYKTSNSPSYNAFVANKKLHVLFNTGKNLKTKNDGRVKAKKGWLQSTSLYDYIYSADGEVSQEKLRDNKGRDVYRPYNGSYQNDKFIMLNTSNSNKKVMILEAKK